MAGLKWYPNLPDTTEPSLREGVRRILDGLYQLRDTLGPLVISSVGKETVEISTDANQIEGMLLQLSRSGKWRVDALVELEVDDSGETFTLEMTVNGTANVVQSLLNVAAPSTHMLAGVWVITAATGDSVAVTIKKAGGGGTSNAVGANSTLVATWQGA